MRLDWAGDGDAELRRTKLKAFRSFVLLHGAARSWLWLGFYDYIDPAALAVSAAVLTLCVGISFRGTIAHLAPRLALPVLAVQLFWTLPYTDNHFFIELLAVAVLCALPRRGATDEALVLQALQWGTAIVLFHTGLQKVLYGHYFLGDFLAYEIGAGGRFADLFGLLLPAAEVLRLQAYDAVASGAGPYRVDLLPFVILSNAVWVAELVLPFGLIWRRTRTLATCAALGLVIAIQLGAREVGFLLLFSNLLLLFLPGPWNRRALPVCAAVYCWAIGTALGILPGAGLLRGGYL